MIICVILFKLRTVLLTFLILSAPQFSILILFSPRKTMDKAYKEILLSGKMIACAKLMRKFFLSGKLDDSSKYLARDWQHSRWLTKAGWLHVCILFKCEGRVNQIRKRKPKKAWERVVGILLAEQDYTSMMVCTQ